MTFALVAVVAFLIMEPVTALVHRYVMHGFGAVWHTSHHRPPRGRLERNDWFPVVFASLTIATLLVGMAFETLWFLVPIGVGITAYGFAYAFVHDVLIHDRVPGVHLPAGWGRYWRERHNVHHVFGAEPFGFLAPRVPDALAAKARRPDAPLPDRVNRRSTV